MFTSRAIHTFPHPSEATDEGLVTIGGDLAPERLLVAYKSGIFPWFEEGLPVLWWSPHPRAILELHALRISRRLARTYRQQRFRLTLDADFCGVIQACADRPEEGTWITRSMIDAYVRLHSMGYAHSVEAWCGDELVGGVYGVAIGGFFAGESMFYRRSDASKVALVHLIAHLRERGYTLFDLQILNDHTARLGATEISRGEYLRRLKDAIELPVSFRDFR